MEIMQSIRNMYEEIITYSGNFGDPIVNSVDFMPLDYIDQRFSIEIRIGAAIGLIVNFCSHADNATFAEAQKGKASSDIVFALSKNAYRESPEITKALQATQNTENELKESLVNVYNLYVKSIKTA